MQPIIEQNMATIKSLFAENQVERAFLFGSVCTDKFNAESDVDVLIKFKDGIDFQVYSENYFHLIEQLENMFGRKVDLLTERSIENPYFLEEINETKQQIYG